MRQPSVGACNTRLVPESTMPGTTTPMPSHLPASLDIGGERAGECDPPSAVTNRRGSRAVGIVTMAERGTAHRIGEHQKGAAGADVDGDTRPLARVDVERCRLTSAGSLADGAFDDVTVVEELLDEQADGAGPDPHTAREVGARDRLVAADQRQGDLPVDLA